MPLRPWPAGPRRRQGRSRVPMRASRRTTLCHVRAYVNPRVFWATRMDYALAIIVLALIAAVVVAIPLRAGPDVDRREDERRAALEAAKEAKYREIRDAELDFRMGKMTEED